MIAGTSPTPKGNRPGYGDVLGVGRYLGAGSPSTARRWTAELRASGLRVYHFGNRDHFRFADVDKFLAAKGADR